MSADNPTRVEIVGHAVLERDHRKINALAAFREDVLDAERRYQAELDNADRIFALRTGGA